jgi:hypothetical protein
VVRFRNFLRKALPHDAALHGPTGAAIVPRSGVSADMACVRLEVRDYHMAESIEVARYKLVAASQNSNEVVARVNEGDSLAFTLEIPGTGDRTRAGFNPRNVSLTVEAARLLIEMTRPGGSR